MAINTKPITGCITPNRGLNTLSPSWLTTCFDSSTNTTNPSLNSILNTIDAKANSKFCITVSHSCNSDFTCDGVADQVEIMEAIAYANTTKLPVYVINDSTYYLTAAITSSNNVGIQVDFGFSRLSGTGAIVCFIENTTSSVNVWKNLRAVNFIDPFQLAGNACTYKFFEATTCTGTGIICSAHFSTFDEFYLNPGLTFYGIYSNSSSNNKFNNIQIYKPSRNSILLQTGANTNKFTNMYIENTSLTNRAIEIDGVNNAFYNNTVVTGTQIAVAPIYIDGGSTIFVGNQFFHSVTSPTACFELSGGGQGSVITGNKMSGWTSGSFQQVQGATGVTGVAGNGL